MYVCCLVYGVVVEKFGQFHRSNRRDPPEHQEILLVALPVVWHVPIIAFFIIFVVIMLTYLMSSHLGLPEESRLRVVPELASGALDQNVLESTKLEPNVLDSSLMRNRAKRKTWSEVATRGCVIMALCSAALCISSRFPGFWTPSWYPIALAGFTLGSTCLACRAWSKAREG
jgi:hypothetical protein